MLSSETDQIDLLALRGQWSRMPFLEVKPAQVHQCDEDLIRIPHSSFRRRRQSEKYNGIVDWTDSVEASVQARMRYLHSSC
jgi:hypothetical protein